MRFCDISHTQDSTRTPTLCNCFHLAGRLCQDYLLGMQIDLEPDEYRSPRSRRNANAHGFLALIALGILGFIWWNRTGFPIDTLFGVSAMFGGFAGAGLIVFFNQWRGV